EVAQRKNRQTSLVVHWVGLELQSFSSDTDVASSSRRASADRTCWVNSTTIPVFIPKCIKDKKYTLAAVAVITALVITIIALAVKKPQPCPLCPPPVDAACPDRWVGYLGKCYYKSEDKRNWSDSESRCSFLGASLAVIDTKPDLVRNKYVSSLVGSSPEANK
uniref:C-type lectin domain-containing protein n=1 Tax=Podarcis muralis TaxID=64176 RepID=A0A670ISA8_PODMU